MQDPSASAAAVYMARKYENTKLAEDSPLHDGTHEQVEEDNWADQLEEDRSFMARGTYQSFFILTYLSFLSDMGHLSH